MLDLFSNFERYPHSPGHRGVETSIAAADDLAPKCGRLQRLTLEAISESGASGLTFEEAAAKLELDFRSIQPRVSELRRMGLVADSLLRRHNGSGKRAIVFTLPQYVRGEAGNG